MAILRCKACGKMYNYEKDGMCPKCGAYNRPPQRNSIYADGTVHHAADYDFERHAAPEAGKVCYEEKECHEDDARRVRTQGSYHAPHTETHVQKSRVDLSGGIQWAKGKWAAVPQKKKEPLIAMVVVLVIVVMGIISSAMSYHVVTPDYPDDSEIEILPSAAEIGVPLQTGDDIYAAVTDWRVRDDGMLEVEMQCDEYPFTWLYYETLDDSGFLGEYESDWDEENGKLTLVYDLGEYDVTPEDCAIEIDSSTMHGSYIVEYWIWLTENTYAVGEAFTIGGVEVTVTDWTITGKEVQVDIEMSSPLSGEGAMLEADNINGIPYSIYMKGRTGEQSFRDETWVGRYSFILRDGDTPHSFVLHDSVMNCRTVRVALS